MNGWLSFVASLPVIAFFGGAGVMAYFIGQTWTTRHNDLAIIALSISCLGIVVVVAAAVTLFLMYAYRQRQMRQLQEDAMSMPRYTALPPARPPAWAEQPPMIEDKSAGSWQRLGQNYDLWPDHGSQHFFRENPR